MAFHKFSDAEKRAYALGKKRGYYIAKNRAQKNSKPLKAQKSRYGNFDSDEFMKKALQKSYGEIPGYHN